MKQETNSEPTFRELARKYNTTYQQICKLHFDYIWQDNITEFEEYIKRNINNA